ncbi:KH domain-containing protein [Bdellovibrio bacteriovorus]|uniref:KH domain-containing protein n=1 Tax=Bdellovibrio bacteriovorus TaxID=959 RepID=UPI0035A70AB3
MSLPKIITRSASSSSSAPKVDVSPSSTDLAAERENGRKLILGLLTELVTDSSSLSIDIEVGERTTVYHVGCKKECIGQILGSKGKNIGAIRTLISSISARKGFRGIVEVPYFSD